MAETSTPGITAPDGSLIVPRNLGDGAGVCPPAREMDDSSITNTANPRPRALDFKLRINESPKGMDVDTVQTLFCCIWFTTPHKFHFLSTV